MPKICACFFSLFLMVIVPAQSNFSALKKNIEQKITYSQYHEALDLINHQRERFPKFQQTELDVLKLECLNDLHFVDEAFALSQNILLTDALAPVLKMRTHIQRALIYEIGLNKRSCKRELDLAEAILKKRPALKPSYYTYFLIRVGSYHRIFGDPETAQEIAITAEQYAESVGDKKNAAILNMLLAFGSYGEPEVAIKHFGKAVQLYKNYNHFSGTAAMYNNIAKLYLEHQDEKRAEIYVDSAIAIVPKVDLFYIVADSYRIKSRIAENQKRFAEALRDYKIATEYTEKDATAERDTKVQELDLMYNFEADKLREQEFASSIKNTRKWNSLLIICTLLLIFFAIVLLYFVGVISKSKDRIRLQNQSISDKNAVLKKNVEEKEFLVRELNHRVKNNLAVILSLVGFQRDEAHNELYKHKFEQLYSRISTISLAHHLFSYNINNFDNSTVEIGEYSESIIAPHRAGYTDQLRVDTDLQSFQLPVDQGLCYGLLLNELLTNSLKHAVPPAGEALKITLSVHRHDGKALLEYEDNGSYFGKKERDKSLGKFIIDAMVEQLGGKCDRKHSMYRVEFPLYHKTETAVSTSD